MEPFGRIFDSYVGILSLFVIAFMLGMAGWFYLFFKKKIAEEEKLNASTQSRTHDDSTNL